MNKRQPFNRPCFLVLVFFSVIGASFPLPAKESAPWWEETFTISTFASCRPGDNLEKFVSGLHGLGFNAMETNTPLEYHAEDLSVEEQRRILDLCQRHGMRYFVTDHKRLTGVGNPSEEALRELISDYSNHPALGGYYVWDEPGREQFASVVRTYAILRANDPEHLPLNAMVPSYGPYRWPDDYPAFARQFVETVNPPVLSFDFYALGKNPEGGAPGVVPTLYRDLQLWSDLAIEKGRPLWFYPSAVSWGGVVEPTLATLRFQVSVAMAYGAKGIQWFMARDFTGGSIDFTGGALTMQGEKGAAWRPLRQVNRWMARLGPTVMTLRREGLAHTAPEPPDVNRFVPGFAGLESASDNLILADHRAVRGREKGERYLWVVNRDLGAETVAELRFTRSIALTEAGSNRVLNSSKKHRVRLEPGEGKLFLRK